MLKESLFIWKVDGILISASPHKQKINFRYIKDHRSKKKKHLKLEYTYYFRVVQWFFKNESIKYEDNIVYSYIFVKAVLILIKFVLNEP